MCIRSLAPGPPEAEGEVPGPEIIPEVLSGTPVHPVTKARRYHVATDEVLYLNGGCLPAAPQTGPPQLRTAPRHPPRISPASGAVRDGPTVNEHIEAHFDRG